MLTPLVAVGLVVAAFVGFNIGGSSTGVAFGPAVGSRIVRKATAGTLFMLFAFLGAWTVGRNVITTMSEGIVPAAQFTPAAGVGVLFFTGLSLLISNIYGVPASTSMTAVGAIVGLGLATGTLKEATMFTIVSAWIVAPLIGLGVGAVIGRYIYPRLEARLSFTRLEDQLLQIDRSGRLPRFRVNEDAQPRDILGSLLVLVIACYMGFSAGASNAANAVAPLVGNGAVSVDQGVLLAVAAISLGGFTIARRTLATVGDGITDLPILAALIVSTVGASIITVLSYYGIPASLAVSTTCCIIGLGWGRASRVATLAELATPPERGDPGMVLNTGALAAASTEDEKPAGPTVGELAGGPEQAPEQPDETSQSVPAIGEEESDVLSAESLFDPAAVSRIVVLWILTPSLSVVGSYLLFTLFV
ncbi:inorganic phosphate transporter, PiT family [Halovenus aranensis]|jgi:PiT family inorganic phosphate transporter|uniref:Phosphate transporter n=1 Tax=Halovenus aranensis TaxID=890420 RepID=A0A1G8SZ28_9EURY|nr:inorganic phosphate transporter [Halovenus aranensis]SDJ34539.1 inorganic phosphate transporter, PiT family [Halovenus aranensis]